MRGLKLIYLLYRASDSRAASRAGSWIETDLYRLYRRKRLVAPRVGSWIETENVCIFVLQNKGRALCGRVD